MNFYVSEFQTRSSSYISNMKLMLLKHRSTCNIKSTVCYWEFLCSCSSTLYHCPIQSGRSSESQGGGHVSYSGTHYMVMGLEIFVKVATKLKSSHCTAATSLQSTLLPVGVLLSRNHIRVLPERNGSTIQSKIAPCLTVQV